MSKRCSAVHGRSFGVAASLFTSLCLFTALSTSPAEAWHRHHHRHRHHGHIARHVRHHVAISFHRRHARAEGSEGGKFAAIVVDGNTGRELYGRNENALRHPASITKVMTLYLLFEELEKGRLHLDSRIPISAHAAAQAPTKIGLRPGQTISVDDAIKAIVTQSANDIAVAVAEDIGGTESNFAAMMTRKAHELGMTRTHYADASGLPNDGQITTAHDLAILGRAIQARFPRYYHYFSLRLFSYHGRAYHNHNHLLGRVDGMDGIKTGYIRASGFNLLASVKRDHHFIIAVVLGGTSAAARDRLMDNLIEAHIDDGSQGRPAPMFAHDTNDDSGASEPERPVAAAPPARQATTAESMGVDPIRSGSLPTPVARPRPAFISAAPGPDDQSEHRRHMRRASLDGSTERPMASSATPTSLRWVVGPAPARLSETAKAEAADAGTKPAAQVDSVESERHPLAHTGWMIQIGATDDLAKAGELLARAKAKSHGSLRRAKAFTEKIRKGSETLYRARFAGLEENTAEAACRSLKRSGFACFATRN